MTVFQPRHDCECGQAPETTKYMLQCPLHAQPCNLDDFLNSTKIPEIVYINGRMRFDDTKEEYPKTVNRVTMLLLFAFRDLWKEMG